MSSILNMLPQLKHLDLKKVVPEMKENKPAVDKKEGEENVTKNPDDLGISPENLLQVISLEWTNEVKRLRQK